MHTHNADSAKNMSLSSEIFKNHYLKLGIDREFIKNNMKFVISNYQTNGMTYEIIASEELAIKAKEQIIKLKNELSDRCKYILEGILNDFESKNIYLEALPCPIDNTWDLEVCDIFTRTVLKKYRDLQYKETKSICEFFEYIESENK